MKPNRVPIIEIMTRDPVTAEPGAPLDEAARIMRDRNVGSVVVVEGRRAVGILTERDLVTKICAENRMPSSMTVKEAMSSPIVSIQPHEDVEEAVRKMSARRIRRLPVVEDGKLVGVVTENDIFRLLPHLVELAREWARSGLDDDGAGPVAGHCDSCGMFSESLVRDGKVLVCSDCRTR